MHHAPRRLTPLLAVALLLPLVTPAARAQEGEAVDLRPAWTEGRVTRYAFDSTRTDRTVVTFNDQTREGVSSFESAGEMTWTVVEVNRNGSAEVEVVYDWLELSFTPPEDGETQSADSRERGGNERLKALVDAVVGQPLTVTFAADGSLESLDGVDRIKSRAAFPEAVPEERDFRESFTDAICLPAAPAEAEVGDDWEQSFTWNHRLGEMAYDTTYELVGVEDMAEVPVATVRAASELDLRVDKSDVPPDAPPINTSLESVEATQDILFDLSRGEAVGRHESQRYTVVVSMNAPEMRMNQRITQQIERQMIRIAEE